MEAQKQPPQVGKPSPATVKLVGTPSSAQATTTAQATPKAEETPSKGSETDFIISSRSDFDKAIVDSKTALEDVKLRMGYVLKTAPPDEAEHITNAIAHIDAAIRKISKAASAK
jgi:hypothetical protein